MVAASPRRPLAFDVASGPVAGIERFVMVKLPDWQDVGAAKALAKSPLARVVAGETAIALSYEVGAFHAVSGVCNRLGRPLGEGTIDGAYVTCPRHLYEFHRSTGLGEPGYDKDGVPASAVKVDAGRVFVDVALAKAPVANGTT